MEEVKSSVRGLRERSVLVVCEERSEGGTGLAWITGIGGDAEISGVGLSVGVGCSSVVSEGVSSPRMSSPSEDSLWKSSASPSWQTS